MSSDGGALLESRGAWIRAHYDAMLAHAQARCGRYAEDVVQDACVRLLRYDEVSLALACTIIRNLSIDRLRAKDSQAVRLDQPITDDEQEGAYAEPGADDPPAPWEVQRDRQAQRQKFYRVMKQLSPEHREVIELVVLGYARHAGTTTRAEITAAGSYDLAASIIACPRGTVASRFARARAAFKKAWERKCGRPYAVTVDDSQNRVTKPQAG